MSCKPNLMSVLQVGKGLEKRLEMAEKKILQAVNETRTKIAVRKT